MRFGDGVHQFILLAMMLVKKQMQLVESVASNLPVMLFVHVAQGHGIREKLVEIFDARFRMRSHRAQWIILQFFRRAEFPERAGEAPALRVARPFVQLAYACSNVSLLCAHKLPPQNLRSGDQAPLSDIRPDSPAVNPLEALAWKAQPMQMAQKKPREESSSLSRFSLRALCPLC